jgi:tRNA-specific 2-thiouridylase
MKKRVVALMSGGVDSSVSAALLKQQGYDVTGVYILGWTGTEEFPCAWQQEEADARAVAEQLGIKFFTVNLAATYEKEVIERFFTGYERGVTPNPDALCNREIKFKAAWEAVRQLEPDYIATGHYAQIKDGVVTKPKDADKDQTYFLWGIDAAMLPRIIFPLGHLTKKAVRALAAEYGLPTAKKKDSQGICFVGPLKVREFLRTVLRPKAGDAVLSDGRIVGSHHGTQLYTIGQRLGSGAVTWTGDVPPLFVIAKDLQSNRLIVGTDQATYAREFTATDANWLAGDPGNKFQAKAKIRYRQAEETVDVAKVGTRYKVRFRHPVRALTPGQSVVFYQGKKLLGGAVIESVTQQQLLVERLYGSKKLAAPKTPSR